MRDTLPPHVIFTVFVLAIITTTIFLTVGSWIVYTPFGVFSGILLVAIPSRRTFFSYVVALLLGVGIALAIVPPQIARMEREKTIFAIATASGTRSVTVEGRVVSAENPSLKYARYVMDITRIDGIAPIATARLLLNTSPVVRYRTGDRIIFRAKVYPPDPIDVSTTYPDSLTSRGIYGVAYPFATQRTGNDAIVHERFMMGIRDTVNDSIFSVFPRDAGALLAGLLTGDSSRTSPSDRRAMNGSGLGHIIAASGYNVAIVASFLLFLSFTFPSFLRIALVFLGIFLYAGLSGYGVPVVRASIMGSIIIVAREYGQRIRSTALLECVALSFVIISPFSVVSDPSFVLSFLAVAGILALRDPLTRLFRRVPSVFFFRESIIITLSATLATLPVTIGLFGNFPLATLVTNLLVAPAIPLAMLFGSLAIFLNTFSEILGTGIGFITYTILEYILTIARVFGDGRFTLLLDIGGWQSVWYAMTFSVLAFVWCMAIRRNAIDTP